MATIIIPLIVNETEFVRLRDIGEFEGTDIHETLHALIERQYMAHCGDVARFIEECKDDPIGPEMDDEIPF